MSLTQTQKVTIQYIAFPNSFGMTECVYVNQNGNIKKVPLSTVFLNSISFYSLITPLSTTSTVSSVPSTLSSGGTPTNVTTPVYLCTPNSTATDSSGNSQLQMGSLYWNFSGQDFYGYLVVLINLNCHQSPALYTYVNVLVSGYLSTTTSAATVSSVNPIVLSPNLQVYDPQAPPTYSSGSYFPSTYADPGTSNSIRAMLHGNIQLTFPAGPVSSWINTSNQYFSASYSPF
jgi:hypothetical protein